MFKLPYHFESYTTFENLIANAPEESLVHRCNPHSTRIMYLNDYLIHLGVKTVVIETDYIDKNFLEDYCRYYSRCFSEYPKKCERLHLFAVGMTDEFFAEKLLEGETAWFQDNYLGFIVLRPLPDAQLAKVCLATYPDNEHIERVFPLLREYRSHLAGIELKVESLAFQEQDKAISACATSALWSAFHALMRDDNTNVPSPFEITDKAKKLISEYSKCMVPNKGLLPSQMAWAIREEGFEPMMMAFVNTSYLKAMIRAYLHARVPIVLGIVLRYEDEEAAPRNPILGAHAVTVTGFHFSDDPDVKSRPFKTENLPFGSDDSNELFLRSSDIDKIYVHDDQLGPFSKMTFPDEYRQTLTTRWNMYHRPEDKINASVSTILLPLYHKIRISYHSIFSIVREYNSLFTLSWEGCKLKWDIYLSTVCDFKAHILKKGKELISDDDIILELLSYRLPKYIWVVDAYSSDGNGESVPEFSFYFDATDIDESELLICILHYNHLSFLRNQMPAEASLYGLSSELRRKIHHQTLEIQKLYISGSTRILRPAMEVK